MYWLNKIPQVECKKAQPKEAVQAANTAALLGKRVILSNLGMMPTLGLPALGGPQTAALTPQQSLQSALQQQLAASAALGLPSLPGYQDSFIHNFQTL